MQVGRPHGDPGIRGGTNIALIEYLFEIGAYTVAMTGIFQGSLLDWCEETGPGPLGATVHRAELAHGAWVDVRPGWLGGADELFGRLMRNVPWRAERRWMYDRVVDVPRLVKFYGEDEALPDPVLEEALDALNAHYGNAAIESWKSMARAGRHEELVRTLLRMHYDPAYDRSALRNFFCLRSAPVFRLSSIDERTMHDVARQIMSACP